MKKWFLGAFVLAMGLFLVSMVGNKKLEANQFEDGDGLVFVDAKKADGTNRSFEEVLAAYKGKVVYVDFWASWCGPCRREFPFSKKLHENYNSDEVVFLYVSFDRQEDAWKKAVNKIKMKGVHFYPASEEARAVGQKYNISGIPRYMLVGKDGKIADANAPRPSANAIAKAIDKLKAK